MTTTERQSPEEHGWPRLRRESLPAQAVQILKGYILTEGLEPGHRLPSERRLADWLNVSRTVLREALIQLISEGVLHRPSPHALCVADFDRRKLAAELTRLNGATLDEWELVELRVFLEIGATDAIVMRVTEEQLREIERWVLDGERRLAAGEPTYPADARFHAALLRSIGNRAIDRFVPLIEDNLRLNLVTDPHQLTAVGTEVDRVTIEEHRLIFEAIKRRDADEAQRLMSSHLIRKLKHRDRTRLDGAATTEDSMRDWKDGVLGAADAQSPDRSTQREG